MTKRLITLITFILLLTAMTYAQNAVCVIQKNGTAVNFLFEQKPTLSYLGDCLVMKTGSETVQFSLHSLLRIETAQVEESTGIDAAKMTTNDKDAVKFSFSDGQITLSNAKVGEQVTLCDIGGKLIGSYAVSPQGTSTIPTASLPKGVYVIRIGDIAYKIIR